MPQQHLFKGKKKPKTLGARKPKAANKHGKSGQSTRRGAPPPATPPPPPPCHSADPTPPAPCASEGFLGRSVPGAQALTRKRGRAQGGR